MKKALLLFGLFTLLFTSSLSANAAPPKPEHGGAKHFHAGIVHQPPPPKHVHKGGCCINNYYRPLLPVNYHSCIYNRCCRNYVSPGFSFVITL